MSEANIELVSVCCRVVSFPIEPKNEHKEQNKNKLHNLPSVPVVLSTGRRGTSFDACM